MPLPKYAGDFLDVALPVARKNGIIHFYDFAEKPEESAERVRQLCRSLGYKIRVINAVVCGSYSPRISRVCVDFKVLGRK
jgi:tRNA G37 N-methylase Trm5